MGFDKYAATEKERMGVISDASAKERAIERAFFAVSSIKSDKWERPSQFELLQREDSGKRKFLEMIEAVDVDHFTLEVWNRFTSPSDLEA